MLITRLYWCRTIIVDSDEKQQTVLCVTNGVWRDLDVYCTMVCYVDQMAAFSPSSSHSSSSFLIGLFITWLFIVFWCWYNCLLWWGKWFGFLQVNLCWSSIRWPEFGMVADIIHLCIDLLEHHTSHVIVEQRQDKSSFDINTSKRSFSFPNEPFSAF